MGPNRGRSGFRGRGFIRGRGRSRGRGTVNRQTLREKDREVDAPTLPSPDQSRSESGVESHAESDASDEEEKVQTQANAYHSLLQSFVSKRRSRPPSGISGRKRRKLYADISSDEEVPNPKGDLVSGDEAVSTEPTEMPAEELLEQDQDDDLSEAEASDLDEDSVTNQGPFESHFENPDAQYLSESIASIKSATWTSKILGDASGGRCVLQLPGHNTDRRPRRKYKTTEDIRLKPRLVVNAKRVLGTFSNLEDGVASCLYEYQDVLFAGRTVDNAQRLRSMVCLHALNHIVKTRDRVLKNNAKLAAASNGEDDEMRDQGFTRPKILFLLETKQACVRAVNSITELYDFEQQENKKRFLDSFSLPEDKFGNDKPDDFRELFEGNDENEFRVGVKLTRKTLKFYSTFYNSDIIFASALGLRRAIEASEKKKHDHDFLSSIEIVIFDQADAALMQNWEHVDYVFEHLNLQPQDAHGCDFSRVRSWYLDGHASLLRQTIVLSAFATPKINTLYSKHMHNVAGRAKLLSNHDSGLIERLTYGIKQTFARFDSKSHLTDPDARFKYFTSTILPQILRLPRSPEGGVGVLLFVPSYLDFVRIRNSLVDVDISYAAISEYTDTTDVRKARSHFMSGRHALILYTGRAHHFHRYNIRGVKRAVFYGLPENSIFYDEILGFINKTVERGEISRVEANVRVCFSKWDRLELERIVGTKRLGKMIGDQGDLFDFV